MTATQNKDAAKQVSKPAPAPAQAQQENHSVVRPVAQGANLSALSDKVKALDAFQKNVNKRLGSGTLSVGKGDAETMKIPRLPTGSPEIDDITGGGLPAGRIVEIYGPEASGKSTICFSTIAQVQKRGGLVGYVDTEHALDREYLMKMGVDLDKMAISQPETAEDALSLVEEMVDAGIFDMIVFDSVAAAAPKKEIEGEMGDSHVGLMARLMSQALRKLTSKVSNTKTCLVFINQIRMKIGVMYGNPETTSGGNALKFYASVRLDVRRIGPIKNGEDVIGQKMSVKTAKCKVAQPFRKVEVSLVYGVGFDQITGVLEEAIEKKVITKSGGAHYLGGDKTQKLASKRSEMLDLLKNDESLLAKIKQLNSVTAKPEKGESSEAEKSSDSAE